MKHALVYAAAIVVVLLSLLIYTHRQLPQSQGSTITATAVGRTIQLKGSTIRVTVAVTPAEREQGLSGRPGLASDEGMLFVFEREGDYAFWMKDMLFSIDIVWIDSAGKIIYIAPSVSPDTYPTAFDPRMNALYVLELPAGYAASHGVSIADVVEL
jgi:uncharacterized membrane protein (UPF0127 family)